MHSTFVHLMIFLTVSFVFIFRDPEGLRTFYYLVQDLKCLVFSLIGLHFKINPIWDAFIACRQWICLNSSMTQKILHIFFTVASESLYMFCCCSLMNKPVILNISGLRFVILRVQLNLLLLVHLSGCTYLRVAHEPWWEKILKSCCSKPLNLFQII